MHIDCHIHTSLCGHSEGDPVDYVYAAAHKKIDLITFTEHIPMNSPGFGNRSQRMGMEQISKYRFRVARAKEVAKRYGVTVLYGIEAEIFPEGPAMREMDMLLNDQHFDYVLGSLHHHLDAYQNWLRSRNIHDDRRIVESYFEHLIEGVWSGRYHSLAHLDVIKAYGTIKRFNPLKHEQTIRRLLQAVVDADICVEINTHHVERGIQQLFPDPIILFWAREMNVQFTLGSDAHYPHHVGHNYKKTVLLLREIGIYHLNYFHEGIRNRIRIRFSKRYSKRTSRFVKSSESINQDVSVSTY